MSMTTILSRRSVVAGVVAGLATLSLAGTAEAAPAAHALPAGQCAQSYNPTTSQSSAHWDIGCKNGEVTVSGWVQHNFGSDCAKVKAVFEGQITEYSGGSCGFWGGKKVYFKWTHPGSLADVYLMDYSN
jgi:hypothetical protein